MMMMMMTTTTESLLLSYPSSKEFISCPNKGLEISEMNEIMKHYAMRSSDVFPPLKEMGI
jgi:hypothetical protein